uniref:WD_REPEATS_REGION domain-containing protein n=1 Tax=Globodera pallida TaxID=36090 RepID=A0A183BNR8_GLOPA
MLGPVQRVVFSRLTGDYTLAAQHPTSIVVWDTERLHTLFSLQSHGSERESLLTIIFPMTEAPPETPKSSELPQIQSSGHENDGAVLHKDHTLSSYCKLTWTCVRLNAFRACTLSANFDTEEARCLVKLTATNLIGSNFVSDGIPLLSLIDQAFDACKDLISQGLWERSYRQVGTIRRSLHITLITPTNIISLLLLAPREGISVQTLVSF